MESGARSWGFELFLSMYTRGVHGMLSYDALWMTCARACERS